MLYFSYTLLAFAAGWILTTYAMREYRLGGMEALLVGGGIGLVCAHGVLLLLMLFLPFAASFDLSLALVAGSFLYPFFWRKNFQPMGQRIRAQLSLLRTKPDWRTSIIAGTLLGGLLIWYADVYFNTLVRLPGGGYAAAFAGYGDVPYHMAQISHLAAGKSLMLDDATYAGLPLKYPFFINFISAIFLRLGAPLIIAFHLPGFFFGSTGIMLLYFLFKRHARSRTIAFAGVLLALFASNTRYLLIFHDPFFSARHSLPDMLTHLGHLPFEVGTKWNATFPHQDVDMTAVLPLFLLHQRASIMGLWSMVAVLTLWAALVEGSSDKCQQKFGTAAAAPIASLIALFPLLHTHGFVALCCASTGWVLFSLIRKEGQARALIRSLLWVSPFLLWEIAYLVAGHSDYTFRPHFRLGWMTNPNEPGGILLDPAGREPMIMSWVRLMWQNFGILLPLFLVGAAGLVLHYRRGLCRDKLWLFIPGSFLLLVIPNLVKFQAWDFDTNKFFLFATVFEVVVLMMLFGELSKTRPRLAKVLLVAIVAAAIPTGLLDTYARTTLIGPARAGLFERDGVQVGTWVWTATRPEAVFVTSDNHLNPVNSLGGRSVVLGFKGWLWSHGVFYENRDRAIAAFVQAPGAHVGEIGTFGSHYVLLDQEWRAQYPQLEKKLYRDFGVPVLSAGQYKVWKF